MIKTNDVMACLPLVASILGDRYGVKVVIGAREASTNGNTIYLPTLPLDCDETLLALARGFCDHEAAHIRHTDVEAVRQAKFTPIQMRLWNSIEDWRVETLLASIFPGCRRHFQWLIRHFFGEDDGAGANPALSVLNWILLTVRAWDLPVLARQRDREGMMIDTAFPGLRTQLEAVLARVRLCCRDTRESIAYALELAAIIEKYVRQAPVPKTGQADTDTSDNQNKEEHPDGRQSENRTDEQDTGGDDDTESASPSASRTDAMEASASRTQALQAAQQALSKLLQASADALPKHLGELMAENLNARQEQTPQNGLSVARISSKSTTDLSSTLREDALQSCIALRTRLQALLQARAQRHCATGRRGRLHPQRLHALAVNNPRVFVRPGEKSLTSAAVHLLLDCSGSMQGPRMKLASLACYATAKALEGCKGVNVGVTLFPASGTSLPEEKTVAPLIRHGERIHHRFSMYPVGSTPLAEALWWVMQQMHPLREERKIILILSDGAPDSQAAAFHVLHWGKALGFEMMGLGIQDNHMACLLPQSSRTIHELRSLAPAMFEMLQNALLRQEGGRP